MFHVLASSIDHKFHRFGIKAFASVIGDGVTGFRHPFKQELLLIIFQKVFNDPAIKKESII